MIPYKLIFERRPRYLYARIEAEDIDRETAISYLREIANKSEELSENRVLLERSIPVMLSDADLLFTTEDFAEMMKGRKVAFLNPHTPISEDMDFAMVIATNRGAEFQLHRDTRSAEAWLSSD
jgi:hypothetical protein